MNHSNEVIRQHTVPKCLLKWFSNDGTGFYEYSFSTKEWQRRNLKKATTEEYFYDISNRDGTKNQEVEHGLARIENDAAILIKEVNERQVQLTPDKKMLLSKFMVIQHYRTTKMKAIADQRFNEVLDRSGRLKLATEASAELKARGASDEQIQDFVDNGNMEQFKDDFYVNSIMRSGISKNLINLVLSMDWRFERIRNGSSYSFVISDCPFSIRKRGFQEENKMAGLANNLSEFYFPFGAKVMLIGSHSHIPQTNHVSLARAEVLNGISIANAFDKIYCNESSSLVSSLIDRTSFRIPYLPNSTPTK